MYVEPNLLKRRSLEGLAIVEDSFREGALAAALRTAPQIERRGDLTPETFERDYRQRQRPVVMAGAAADWPAVREWSFDALARRCGQTQVTVNAYSSQRARQVSFADFVDMLRNAGVTGSAPVYLQEWYYQADCPELAADLPELLIAQYDHRRALYGEQVSNNHQLWLGQAGGITRLHQDSYMVDVMHVQLVGSKRWSVLGPQAFLHERPDGTADWETLMQTPAIELMQCVIEPGDVLYLPALWFHRIELLQDSIGLGRKCLDPRHLRMHIHQRMAELLALALNPEEIKATHPELFNVVMMRNRTWARRMNIDLSKLRP